MQNYSNSITSPQTVIQETSTGGDNSEGTVFLLGLVLGVSLSALLLVYVMYKRDCLPAPFRSHGSAGAYYHLKKSKILPVDDN